MKYPAILASVLVLLAGATSALAKNFIYKGTFSSTDLVTGKTRTEKIFFVLSDESLVDGGSPNYFTMTATVVIYGNFPPVNQPKRYLAIDFGLFRSLELPRTASQTAEIFTQSRSSDTADGGPFHNAETIVLSGVFPSANIYPTPATLKGYQSGSHGQLAVNDPSTGSATRAKYTFKLDRDLTDRIASDESKAAHPPASERLPRQPRLHPLRVLIITPPPSLSSSGFLKTADNCRAATVRRRWNWETPS